MEPKTEDAGRGVKVSQLDLGNGTGWVDEHSDLACRRYHFMQQFEPLRAQISV
jgi:hypothetical protein